MGYAGFAAAFVKRRKLRCVAMCSSDPQQKQVTLWVRLTSRPVKQTDQRCWAASSHSR